MGKCLGKCSGKVNQHSNFFYINCESQELHEIKGGRNCISSLNTFITPTRTCAIGYLSGNKLMLAGGLNQLNEKVKDSYIIQVELKRIKTLSLLPYGIEGGSLHEYKEWVYYLGGIVTDISVNRHGIRSADLFRYHITENYWQKIINTQNGNHINRNINLNQIQGFGSILHSNFVYIIGGRVIDDPNYFLTSALRLNLDTLVMEITNFQLPFEILNPFCCKFHDKILILQGHIKGNDHQTFSYELNLDKGFHRSNIQNFPETIVSSYPALSDQFNLRVLGFNSWYRLRITDSPYWDIIPNSLPAVINGLGFQTEVLPGGRECTMSVSGLSVSFDRCTADTDCIRQGRVDVGVDRDLRRVSIRGGNAMRMELHEESYQEDLDDIHIVVPRRLTADKAEPATRRENSWIPEIESPKGPESIDPDSDQEILVNRLSGEKQSKLMSEAEEGKNSPDMFPKYNPPKTDTNIANNFKLFRNELALPLFPQSKPENIPQVVEPSSNISLPDSYREINSKIHKKSSSGSSDLLQAKQLFPDIPKYAVLHIEYSQSSSSSSASRTSSSGGLQQSPRPAQKIINIKFNESAVSSGIKDAKIQIFAESRRSISDNEEQFKQGFGLTEEKYESSGNEIEKPEFPPELYFNGEGFEQDIQFGGFPVPRQNTLTPLGNAIKDSDTSKEYSDFHESTQKISRNSFSCSENSITPNNLINSIKFQESIRNISGNRVEKQRDIVLRDRELEDLSNSSCSSSSNNRSARDEASRRNILAHEEEEKLFISKKNTKRLMKLVCNELKLEQQSSGYIEELLISSKIVKVGTLPQAEYVVCRIIPNEETFRNKYVKRIALGIHQIFGKAALSEEQVSEIQEYLGFKDKRRYSNIEIARLVITVVKFLILSKL